MSRTREKIFLTLTMVLCVLLFAVRLTGPIGHVLLGVVLTIAMVAHLIKQKRKMKYQKPAIRLVDQVLLAALIVMFVTGMLIHPFHGMFVVKLLHKFSAVLFVLGIVGHVAQHSARRKQFSKKKVVNDVFSESEVGEAEENVS